MRCTISATYGEDFTADFFNGGIVAINGLGAYRGCDDRWPEQYRAGFGQCHYRRDTLDQPDKYLYQ